MLVKWLAAVFQHGLISVFALVAAIAAVWWVEPTTNGGTAFVLLVTFLLALAMLELGRRLLLGPRARPAPAAATPQPTAPQPTADAPPAARAERARKRRRGRR